MFIIQFAYAQKMFISTNKTNAVFIGAENPISINIPGYKFSELFLKVNYGTIKKNKEAGKYLWTICDANEKAKAVLKVYCNNYLIKSFKLPIKKIRNPELMIGNGNHRGFSLKNCVGVRAELHNFQIENIKMEVKSFTFSIYKANTKTLTANNTGAFFQSDTRKIIENLESGDLVIISNIIVQLGCEQKPRHIQDLGFNIFD